MVAHCPDVALAYGELRLTSLLQAPVHAKSADERQRIGRLLRHHEQHRIFQSREIFS